MTSSYARACTEVLVLLKYYLEDDDYNKIPKDVIAFYEKNKDINYRYEIDSSLPLEEQEISEKANAIIVTIFRDYFATETQKEKLENILINNDKIIEEQKREKYNPDKIFQKNQVADEAIKENTELIKYQEQNIFTKIIHQVKEFFLKFINKL